MSSTKVAFVLVGGKGTRLRSAVSDRPKPMAEVNGRPFLEHPLDYWISQGVEEFVLCVGYMAEFISHHFQDAYRGARLKYSFDDGDLGTGGALSKAMTSFPQQASFLIMNGDTFFSVRISELEIALAHSKASWVMALFRSNDTQRYSPVALDESHRVVEVDSPRKASSGTLEGSLINGGVHLVKGNQLNRLSAEHGIPFSTEEALMHMIQKERLHLLGLPVEGEFIDIGTPSDYLRAQSLPAFLNR